MKQYLPFAAFVLSASTFAASPIPVKIHFFEALAPKDTTSSERFQKEYDGAIATAKLLTATKLKKCGYELDSKTIFYNASDALEALERGKVSASQDVWMIVGPRRSNHYVLLTKGAPEVPSVSTMASSQEVETLGNLHISMAPTNKQMAKVAAKEAKTRTTKSKNYISLVSEDCVACVDFSDQFDQAAKLLGLKKQKEFKVTGESPELGQIAAEVKKLNPAFILLPNYSKVSAQAIAALHKVAPSAFFVGGDGWGDSRFGFVQDAQDLDGTDGFTIRGFPTTDEGLKGFGLGRDLLASKDANVHKPGSAAALSLLKIIDSSVELLCSAHPKNQAEFKAAFSARARQSFKSPWGVSSYALKNGDISFGRTIKQ
jgi:hypothetical protein